MSDGDSLGVDHSARALRSVEVFPADQPVAVLSGALAAGAPMEAVVLAEHVPLLPGGEPCRACRFVYAGQLVCPALLLAVAGCPLLADRVRQVLAADRRYGPSCESTIAVQRMDARVDVIGARVTAGAPARLTRPRSLYAWFRGRCR